MHPPLNPAVPTRSPSPRILQHRDLKLENILIESGGKNGSGTGGGTPAIKLVDFGLSAIYQENGVSTDVLGSWVRAACSLPALKVAFGCLSKDNEGGPWNAASRRVSTSSIVHDYGGDTSDTRAFRAAQGYVCVCVFCFCVRE